MKRDKKSNYSNVGIGEFPLNKIPDGRFRIYYFRPKNRERLISAGAYKPTAAQDKIQKVGRGLDFYIFDKQSQKSTQRDDQSSVNQSFNSLS